MSKHLHNISAVLSAGKFVHLSNFYIDYHPLQRIQEIERSVWYSIRWRWAWNSVGYVDCLQFLPHNLADAFFQPICLLRRKNGLYQKLFAFG